MKSRIPTFKSFEEERRFWQAHSVTEFADELTPVKLKFAPPRQRPRVVKLSAWEFRALQHLLGQLAPHATHRKS